MKTFKKFLAAAILTTLITSSSALANDCTISLNRLTSSENIGGSSLSSSLAVEEMTKILESKGYTIDPNSENYAYAGFGCVLYDGEPVIKLAIVSAGIRMNGQDSVNVDAEGTGLTYSASERRAFRKVMRKFSKTIPECSIP